MIHIIKNDLGITKDKIDKEITRVKALLINSDNEILLGYGDNCYQFIGGHLEANETLLECLNREIKEEVGIDLNVKNIEPFLFLEHYCNDHPEILENRNCKVYYYAIKTDLKPNLDMTSRTKQELATNFTYKYVKLDDFIETVKNNYNKYNDAKIIGEEIINAYKIYKENYESINN